MAFRKRDTYTDKKIPRNILKHYPFLLLFTSLLALNSVACSSLYMCANQYSFSMKMYTYACLCLCMSINVYMCVVVIFLQATLTPDIRKSMKKQDGCHAQI